MPTTEDLYRELHGNLLAFVSKRVSNPDDARDIVHDVFVRIHTHGDKLAQAESVTGWIYRVTRNAIVDHYRERSAATSATERYAQQPLPDAPEVVVSATELLSECVRPFVEELPLEYQQALELTDLGAMTQKEASAELGISVSGMKSRVQRARGKLGVLLRNCCEIELDSRCGIMDFEPRAKKEPKSR